MKVKVRRNLFRINATAQRNLTIVANDIEFFKFDQSKLDVMLNLGKINSFEVVLINFGSRLKYSQVEFITDFSDLDLVNEKENFT